MNTHFSLPTEGRTYLDRVIARCEDLIESDIWGDLDKSCLRRWKANFKTDEEEYFAACVLDALIYRSKKQTIAMIDQLFDRVLPDLTRKHASPLGHISDWRNLLSGDDEPYIRLVAAVASDDDPTKSAHIITRLIKQSLRIKGSWLIEPKSISDCLDDGVKVFIFCDDFLGTGHQFEDIIIAEGIDEHLSKGFFAYTPLVAHETGLDHLQGIYPDLHLSSVEKLDETYSIFHQQSEYFNDGTNSPAIAREFYYSMLKKYEIHDSFFRRGYGDLELLYAFEHATPDNSLPILWYREKSWNPLFEHR